MNLHPDVKNGVEKILANGIEYLEAGDYVGFYRSIPVDNQLLTGITTEVLTQTLGDPSAHLDFIPEYYLAYTTIKSFSVSEKFKQIELCGFADSTLEILSVNCEKIGVRAFYGCRDLTTVIMGTNVRWIAHRAFIGCDHLKELKYKGTVQQWQKIYKSAESFMKGLQVICTDGQFMIL